MEQLAKFSANIKYKFTATIVPAVCPLEYPRQQYVRLKHGATLSLNFIQNKHQLSGAESCTRANYSNTHIDDSSVVCLFVCDYKRCHGGEGHIHCAANQFSGSPGNEVKVTLYLSAFSGQQLRLMAPHDARPQSCDRRAAGGSFVTPTVGLERLMLQPKLLKLPQVAWKVERQRSRAMRKYNHPPQKETFWGLCLQSN